MQSIHVYDPAKIIKVIGLKPVEISGLINFIAFNRRIARRLDFNLHVFFRKVLVGGDILIGDEVAIRPFLEKRAVEY